MADEHDAAATARRGDADWVDAGPRASLAPGQYRLVEMDGIEAVVFAVDDGLYAFENICPHDFCALMAEPADAHHGRVERGQIYCPRHGARFDLRSGAVLAPPAIEPLPAFSVRERRGRIEVRDPRFDPAC